MNFLTRQQSAIRVTSRSARIHQLYLDAQVALARLNSALAASSPATLRACAQPARWVMVSPESANPFGEPYKPPADRFALGRSFGPPIRSEVASPTKAASPPAKAPAPSIDDLLSGL